MIDVARRGNASRNCRVLFLHPACVVLVPMMIACASSSSVPEGSLAATGTPSGPSARSAECIAVADSVRTSMSDERLPGAVPDRRLRYPTPPPDAAVGIPVETFAIVDPDGGIDSTTFRVTGTGDGAYKRAMLHTISRARWRPARVGECRVWSRISIKFTYLGVERLRR